jgi:hypothetical protein
MSAHWLFIRNPQLSLASMAKCIPALRALLDVHLVASESSQRVCERKKRFRFNFKSALDFSGCRNSVILYCIGYLNNPDMVSVGSRARSGMTDDTTLPLLHTYGYNAAEIIG